MYIYHWESDGIFLELDLRHQAYYQVILYPAVVQLHQKSKSQHMDKYSEDGIRTQSLDSYWNREPDHEIDLPGRNGRFIDAQAIFDRDTDKARLFLTDLSAPEPEPVVEDGSAEETVE